MWEVGDIIAFTNTNLLQKLPPRMAMFFESGPLLRLYDVEMGEKFVVTKLKSNTISRVIEAISNDGTVIDIYEDDYCLFTKLS
jgi:hypothetical protein